MNVIVTGGSGRVGGAIADHLCDDYEITFLDIDDAPYDVVTADITEYDELRPHFEGADAVVHLAGIPHTSASWEEVLSANIVGTRNVFEAASQAGVDRIVFASSNHVVGLYSPRRESVSETDAPSPPVDESAPVRPSSYYAVSKSFGEDLGRYYVENRRSPDRFYALRIGWVVEAEYDYLRGPADRAVDRGDCERGSDEYQRLVATVESLWLSRRDLARIVSLALTDETVRYGVYHAASDLPNSWLDLGAAREGLGYDPLDGPE